MSIKQAQLKPSMTASVSISGQCPLAVRVRIVYEDLHAEAFQQLCERASNRAGTRYADRPAVHVEPEQITQRRKAVPHAE